jgi:hypothetical protein
MERHAVEPDRDWRLRIQLTEGLRWGGKTASGARHLGQLEWIVESERIRSDVTVTYDGKTVYAYGSTMTGLHAADRAIRKALVADGRTAEIRTSHWDERSGSWQEFDPAWPPGYEPAAVPAGPPQQAVTRTAECGAGRLVSRDYLNEVEAYAQQHELECRIVSTTRLFRTRLEVTFTGPEDQVRDALTYIRALGKGSSKIDPGLIPYGGL